MKNALENQAKDRKIEELQKLQRQRTSSRDRATQSSEEGTQNVNVQEEAKMRFIEENDEEDILIQMEDHYPDLENKHFMHKSINPHLKPWHLSWTTVKVGWSWSGRWVPAPVYQDTEGDDPRSHRIARIEKYIDKKGQIKEVLAYG